jgi:hypothetical protein
VTIDIKLYDWHSKLGRHLVRDPRSMSFAVSPTTAIKPARHDPAIPVLDQEDLFAQGISVKKLFPKIKGVEDVDALGSCVGNATTYAASNVYAAVLASINLSATDAVRNEKFAIRRYHRATQMDEQLFQQYPNDDCGSSGLGTCKALKADKLISSYRWANDARGVATLLQSGGVMLGVPWYQSWFDPDSDGFIDGGNWDSSGLAGGHEIYVAELETWDDRDLSKCVIRFVNSWSKTWGDHGSGRLRLSTYAKLADQIDAKQIVR